MRHLIYVVPVIFALWLADGVLSEGGRIGWERNSVFDARKRVKRSRARRIVLFGSSTSVDWLRPGHVAKIFGMRPQDVLDAHINGCHQACTRAQVLRMLRTRRRFQIAFYGTNQFQMCEYPHSKRVLQQVMNLPPADVPDTLGIYLHAEQPLNYLARFVGISLSDAYGDTAVLHRRWSKKLFGGRRGNAWRWALKKRRRKKKRWEFCPYESASQVAYKEEMMRSLLDLLGELADRVFVNILPDENLSERDPKRRVKVQSAWMRHRALMTRMCKARRWVTCIDLSGPRGARLPQHFRDGFHMSGQGAKLQLALLIEQLRAGGHIPKRRLRRLPKRGLRRR